MANLIVEVSLERQMVEAIARAGPSGLNNVKVRAQIQIYSGCVDRHFFFLSYELFLSFV